MNERKTHTITVKYNKHLPPDQPAYLADIIEFDKQAPGPGEPELETIVVVGVSPARDGSRDNKVTDLFGDTDTLCFPEGAVRLQREVKAHVSQRTVFRLAHYYKNRPQNVAEKGTITVVSGSGPGGVPTGKDQKPG